MIIGISGKIGSGKDTLAAVIQYVDFMNRARKKDGFVQISKIQEGPEGVTFETDIDSVWKIKKYADKLKEMVCIMIGCTREQLEDREFKEKELGEEWWKYKMSYTDRDVYVDYSTHREYDENEMIEMCNEAGCTVEVVKTTPRLLMQLLGTECGRQILHPNIWVNALMADYKILAYNQSKKRPIYPNWIITDVRFPNEVRAIKDAGGIVIRINRYCYDSGEDFLVCHPDEKIARKGVSLVEAGFDNSEIEKIAKTHGYVPLREQHESEIALDNYKGFDYVINNNGAVGDLINKVFEIDLYEN